MPALDLIHVGLPLPTRSLFCFGSSLPMYGMARLEFSLLVTDFAILGFLSSLQSYVQLGLLMFVSGMNRSDLLSLVLNSVHLGSLLSMRSFIQSESLPFVYGLG